MKKLDTVENEDTRILTKNPYICYPVNVLSVVLERYGDEKDTVWNYNFKLWEALLNKLDSKGHLIIEKRYKDGCTLKEIGETLGVTRERVRQLESLTLHDLSCELEKCASVDTTEFLRCRDSLGKVSVEKSRAMKLIGITMRGYCKPDKQGSYDYLITPLSEMGFSNRAMTVFDKFGIELLGELICLDVTNDAMFNDIWGFGKSTREEVADKVKKVAGYEFKNIDRVYDRKGHKD